MIEQLLDNANDKIIEFASLGNTYIRLRFDYITMQNENQIAFHKVDQPSQVQEYVKFYIKRMELEKQLKEMSVSLNEKYNEAIQILFKGLEIDNIISFDIESIKKLQRILSKLYTLANIDVFKGILYVNDVNRLTLQKVVELLKDKKDYPQYLQILNQIQLLFELKKSDNNE